MYVGILGINHKSATLRLREKLAKVAEQLFGPSHTACFRFSSVLLSTCNRTEIYFQSEELALTHTYLLNAMRESMEEEFEHCIYSYFGIDCFFHLARVTAGVDSALIGETEIQGQVKRAYEMAQNYRPLASELHFLFQKCLKIGKEVRSQHPAYGLPSIENAVLNIGLRVFGNLRDKNILFVGLSEINHKIFMRLKKLGCKHIFFCNRTWEKAQEFAEKEGAALLPWRELDSWPTFDCALFGTKSPHFLVHREELASANMVCRLVIDLSVPRNVDPKIGRHPAITLLNVDQLNQAIDRKRKLKALELARIETQVIAQSVQRQAALFQLKERQRNHYLLSKAS
jgi:glutamyl-tRNA reductase